MLQGDWCCSKCGDHQFARNVTCRRCGEARPAGDATGLIGFRATQPEGGTPTASIRDAPQNRRQPGDWICPQCQDVQLVGSAQCRRCGTARRLQEQDEIHPCRVSDPHAQISDEVDWPDLIDLSGVPDSSSQGTPSVPEASTVASSAIWKKFRSEDGGAVLWLDEAAGDWFIEDHPGAWCKYKDPASGRVYWWKDDLSWFWAD